MAFRQKSNLAFLLAALTCLATWAAAQNQPTPPPAPTDGARAAPQKLPQTDEPEVAILSGKVQKLFEAFQRAGIVSYEEEIKNQVALVTGPGEIFSIVPDWRGRAFYQDERLRDRAVDLVVHRRRGVPWIQVLSIYTFDEKGVRNITDYWCDICAIPMYEIKECECCQGPIRLRFRPQELPTDLQSVKTPKKK